MHLCPCCAWAILLHKITYIDLGESNHKNPCTSTFSNLLCQHLHACGPRAWGWNVSRILISVWPCLTSFAARSVINRTNLLLPHSNLLNDCMTTHLCRLPTGYRLTLTSLSLSLCGDLRWIHNHPALERKMGESERNRKGGQRRDKYEMYQYTKENWENIFWSRRKSIEIIGNRY